MHRNAWQKAKSNFDMWADTQEHIYKSYSDLQYHKFGNKPGKLLARLCKGAHTPTYISSLKDTKGNTCSSPNDISNILE